MISEAFAMAPNVAAQGQGAAAWQPLIMVGVMFAIFYVLLIRPQQKRAKAHKEMVNTLQVGDSVVTIGGMHGKVTSVQDDCVTLEVAAGTKIKFNRTAIASKS